MANPLKAAFLAELSERFGPPRKMSNSESLYELGNNKARLYIRYSKRHPRNRTFFGLRKIDLGKLQGHEGILCFLWDGQRDPLFVPYSDFEEVFATQSPASDGQFKVQVYESPEGTELYLANAGRFSVESFMGWDHVEQLIQSSSPAVPDLSHVQIQTLLGGVGAAKGYDIWIPANDRGHLDWNLAPAFHVLARFPSSLATIKEVAEEIDVIWMDRGAGQPIAFYEVEHSTPIYSGLLRFNDVHLMLPHRSIRYGIVSNDQRRAVFVRQLKRPTFNASGLSEICAFFEYGNVYGWYQRLQRKGERLGA